MVHSSINLVPTISTLLHFWSLAWWACIGVCDPQTGRPLWSLLLHNAVIRGYSSFLHLKLTCFLLSPRICFQFFLDFSGQCLCPDPCFIKQLPNCMSISLSCPGSVVDHWNLEWKRPSGLPLSPPGRSSCSRARSFLIGWYLQHCPIWKRTLRFLSRQPLFSLNVSKWNNTKQNIHTYIFFWWYSPH